MVTMVTVVTARILHSADLDIFGAVTAHKNGMQPIDILSHAHNAYYVKYDDNVIIINNIAVYGADYVKQNARSKATPTPTPHAATRARSAARRVSNFRSPKFSKNLYKSSLICRR